MNKKDPVGDELPLEAFSAIRSVFKAYQREPKVIVLAGLHTGESAVKYLEIFPNAKIYGFEPDIANYQNSKVRLSHFGNQVIVFPYALASTNGAIELNINSNDATHSIYKIGSVELWDSYVYKVESRQVEAISIDNISTTYAIDNIDILHLDIQGGELGALQGCSNMLESKRIFLIRCESEFARLYQDQPLFWDIGKFISSYNYRFLKNVDKKFRSDKIPKLIWADSLFIRE